MKEKPVRQPVDPYVAAWIRVIRAIEARERAKAKEAA